MTWQKLFNKTLIPLIIIFLIIYCIPLFVAISLSIREPRLTFIPSILPESITFYNYINLFQNTGFLRYASNSVFLLFLTQIIVILVSLVGVLVINTLKSKHFQHLILFLILIGYLIPPIVLGTSYYCLITQYRIDNYWSILVIGYVGMIFPTVIFAVFYALKNIPSEIKESAIIDRATSWNYFWKIEIPIIKPIIFSFVIFGFVVVWDDFTFARIIIQFEEYKTLTIGLLDLYNASSTDWGLLMSFGVTIILMASSIFLLFVYKFYRKLHD